MKPVRLAIVGCGAITESGHLPAALRSPDVDVLALVDVKPVNARRLATRFGISCVVTDDLESVLDQVEGVLIATPNNAHVEPAVAALKRGVPALIEKPIAVAYEDALQICDAADAAGAFVAVGYRSRFWPSVRWLRHLLETKYLGGIQSFKYCVGTSAGWASVSGFNLNRQMAGGGILIDSHVIDKMLYWFGEPVEFSYADDSHGGVEATCKAKLRFDGPDGPFSGWLFLSKTLNLANALVLETERYSCELAEAPSALVTLRERNRSDIWLSVRHVGSTTGPEKDHRDDFQRQLEEFARNIRQRGAITVDGRFAARSIKLINAMYENRSRLAEPWIHRSTEMERASL